MNIDPNTGLPELPDGYFWRIKKGTAEYVLVQIRRKRFLGSSVAKWSAVQRVEATSKRLAQSAQYVFGEWAEKPMNPDWRNLLGDYPPKKLEVTS